MQNKNFGSYDEILLDRVRPKTWENHKETKNGRYR